MEVSEIIRQRKEAQALSAQGLPLKEIAREMDLTVLDVLYLLKMDLETQKNYFNNIADLW